MNKLERYVYERWGVPLPIALRLECLAKNMDWLEIKSETEMRAYLKDCVECCLNPKYVPEVVDKLMEISPFKVMTKKRFWVNAYLYGYVQDEPQDTVFKHRVYSDWETTEEKAYEEYEYTKARFFKNPRFWSSGGMCVLGGSIELIDVRPERSGDDLLAWSTWVDPEREHTLKMFTPFDMGEWSNAVVDSAVISRLVNN